MTSLGPGSKVGLYEVVALLGAGGMGEVYRAKDPRLGREVAVKILPDSVAGNPDRLRRFENEARAAGGLNHPNIVAVYDVGRDGQAPFVVTELLEGQTLRERLVEGLSVRKAVDIAVQAAHGLAAAHEKGIVHRDLKPENIFLTRDGRVKILDFGLAKLVAPGPGSDAGSVLTTETHGTDAGTVLGTAGYMSPEQVRGAAVDHRSDIFSLGAVVYEMLTSRRAFRRDTAPETMTAILREEVPAPSQASPEVTPALDRIVARCLDKSPDERFQSARDLAFALTALSGSVASGVLAAQPAPRRRHVVAALVAGAALVAAVLGGAAAAVRLANRPFPTFTQLTFRRGDLSAARFAPDGQTIVYSAEWERDPHQVYTTRPGSPESRPLNLIEADLFAISSSGEMAIGLDPVRVAGNVTDAILARVPLAGGAPREVLDEVAAADWGPGGDNLAVVRHHPGGWRIEYPPGKTVVDTEGPILAVRVSPDGNDVAFLKFQPGDYFTGTLEVVGRDGRPRTLARDLYYPRGIAWTADGREVWFSTLTSPTPGASELRAVSLAGRERIVTRVPGWMRLLDRFRDGRVLMSRVSVRTSTVVGRPGAPEQDLSWHDSTTLADLAGDGRTVLFNETLVAGGGGWSVYLRRTDGSPAVRLGDGFGWALSPDGRWVVASLRSTPPRFILLPTGAGEARTLQIEGGGGFRGASWFPDSRSFAFARTEPTGGARLFVQDASGASPQPTAVRGNDLRWPIVSPDGRSVAAIGDDGTVWVYALADGVGRRVPEAAEGEIALQWSADGRSLFVFQPLERTVQVFLVGIDGGRKLWREFTPADPVGVGRHSYMAVNPTATAWAYSYTRILGEMYLVEGLR